ncbi:MAG: hypothetical protein WA092_01610 [Minisyncoccales bacterium]
MSIYITTSTALGLSADCQNDISTAASHHDMVFVLSETDLSCSSTASNNNEVCKIWTLEVLSVCNYEDVFWEQTVASSTCGVICHSDFLPPYIFSIIFPETSIFKTEKEVLSYLIKSLRELDNFVIVDSRVFPNKNS